MTILSRLDTANIWIILLFLYYIMYTEIIVNIVFSCLAIVLSSAHVIFHVKKIKRNDKKNVI